MYAQGFKCYDRITMAEIFLTGATGFVGRHLVPALIREGHHLWCLVRSVEKAAQLRARGCQVVVGDLTSDSFSVEGAEIVIHLAALHHGLPTLISRVTAEGTAQLVQAAQAQGVKKILSLSTVTAAQNPSWPYAYAAWLAEQAIQASSVRYTILRSTVIVGPGDPFLGGIMYMAQAWPVVPIIGSGRTRFQPVSVFDIVRCVLQAITDERYTNRVLTVGGPEVLSYEQIVDTVFEALRISKRKISLPRRTTRFCVRWLERMGVRTPFVPGHFLSQDLIASSPSVIEDEFGFRPQALRAVLHAILSRCVTLEKSVA